MNIYDMCDNVFLIFWYTWGFTDRYFFVCIMNISDI